MSKHAAGPGAPAFPTAGTHPRTPKHRKQDRNPEAREVQELAKAS